MVTFKVVNINKTLSPGNQMPVFAGPSVGPVASSDSREMTTVTLQVLNSDKFSGTCNIVISGDEMEFKLGQVFELNIVEE